MKRIIVLALIAAFLVVVPLSNHLWADDKDDNVKKVDVCHNGKTISISVNALGGHLGHGDTEGACP